MSLGSSAKESPPKFPLGPASVEKAQDLLDPPAQGSTAFGVSPRLRLRRNEAALCTSGQWLITLSP